MMSEKKKVLMVCLGNSCRSPMAEAVFNSRIKEMGLNDSWEVDSAAILQYHVGLPPEPRATATLKKNGIYDYYHKAKLITLADFYKYDWIFGMDNYIMKYLYEMQPKKSKAKIELLGKYNPNEEVIIKDPLFDSDSVGFEKAFKQSVDSINQFLKCQN